MSIRHECDILCFGQYDIANIAKLKALLPNVRVMGVVSPAKGIRKYLRILLNLVSGLPPSFAAFFTKTYVDLLHKCLVENIYNVIHYDVVNMAQYQKVASAIPSVHSPSDATSLVYLKMANDMPISLMKIKLRISENLLRRFERRNYPLFGINHVVSYEDASYLKALDTAINVVTIPIAIDDAFLQPVNKAKQNSEPLKQFKKIVCTGNLGNPAIAKGVLNFVNNALPLILKQWPTVIFIVLGQNVSKDTHAKLLASPNTEFLNWIEDYRDFLSRADIVLVPDQVGPPGAKTRTLQAMGLGLPVVGTHTAFSGIPFVNGKHGMLYETMSECAALINSLIGDKRARRIIGDNANALVSAEYSFGVIGPKYEQIYCDLVSDETSPVNPV